MIRKLRIKIGPVAQVYPLQELLSHCRDEWPTGWEALAEPARTVFENVWKENHEINELVEHFNNHPGTDWSSTPVAPETTEDASLSLWSHEVELDLARVMDDPERGIGALRRAAMLLRTVRTALSFVEECKLGVKRADTEQVLEYLAEFAKDSGYSIEVEVEPDLDFGDAEEDEDAEEDDEDERPSSAPRRPVGDPPQVSGRFSNSGGTFGGLKDGPAHSPPGVPSLGLHEHEHFFVYYTSLAWPAAPDLVRKHWKFALVRVHPDVNPDDPNAHARFTKLRDGYERLCRRLGVSP